MKATGINVNGEQLEFDVVDGVVKCSYNQLTSLTLPKGVEGVYCSFNLLTELTLPEGVKRVKCSDNQLTSLILPEGVEWVYCRGNQLTSLTLPKGVKEVNCSSNQLTSLILPEGVEWVNCSDNQFTNGENYFINPRTERVVIKQGDLYYCGCCCGMTSVELKNICEDKGFSEIIEHFNL